MSDTQICTGNTDIKSAVLARPVVGVYEAPNGYVMEVEMPGVDNTSIDVSVERGVLKITGASNVCAPEGFSLISGERVDRKYQRSFRLSEDINVTGIDASMKDGILTLTIPKVVEPEPHKIPVKG